MPSASSRRRVSRAAPSDGRPSAPPPPSSFLVPRKTFSHQFAALYFVRLHALRPECQRTALRSLDSASTAAGEALPTPSVCRRLLDVQPSGRCLLTGTLYKEQKFKPSILADYSAQKKGKKAPTLQSTASQLQKEQEGEGEGGEGGQDGGGEGGSGGGQQREGGQEGAGDVSHVGRWVSSDDEFILEDETGRIVLVEGDGPPCLLPSFCTGVVMAVLGRQEDKGRFRVERIFVPELAPQPPLPSPSPSSPAPPPRLVLLLSGLSFGCPSVDPLPLQLLQDYVSGFIGGTKVCTCQPAPLSSTAHPACAHVPLLCFVV